MTKPIIITTMLAIAALLLMAESEDVAVLLMSKAAGFALGYAAARLCDRWQSALSNFINEEEE